MEFNTDSAKGLGKLSRLEFSDEKLNQITNEFGAILEQVSLINKVDVSNIDLKQDDVVDILNLRKDEVVNTFTQEQVLQNAPEKKDGAFLVPLTVE